MAKAITKEYLMKQLKLFDSGILDNEYITDIDPISDEDVLGIYNKVSGKSLTLNDIPSNTPSNTPTP